MIICQVSLDSTALCAATLSNVEDARRKVVRAQHTTHDINPRFPSLWALLFKRLQVLTFVTPQSSIQARGDCRSTVAQCCVVQS